MGYTESVHFVKYTTSFITTAMPGFSSQKCYLKRLKLFPCYYRVFLFSYNVFEWNTYSKLYYENINKTIHMGKKQKKKPSMTHSCIKFSNQLFTVVPYSSCLKKIREIHKETQRQCPYLIKLQSKACSFTEKGTSAGMFL